MSVQINKAALKAVSKRLRTDLELSETQGRQVLDSIARGLGYASYGALKPHLESTKTASQGAEPTRGPTPTHYLSVVVHAQVPEHRRQPGFAQLGLPGEHVVPVIADDPTAARQLGFDAFLALVPIADPENYSYHTSLHTAEQLPAPADSDGHRTVHQHVAVAYELVNGAGENAHADPSLPWQLAPETRLAGMAAQAVRSWIESARLLRPDLKVVFAHQVDLDAIISDASDLSERQPIGYQLFNWSGCIHGEDLDPFDLLGYQVLSEQAAETAREWLKSRHAFHLEPVYPGEFDDAEIVAELPKPRY